MKKTTLFPALLLTFAMAFSTSCKKKEDPKPCFSNEIAGNYVGELTEQPATVIASPNAGVRVTVDACDKLTIQATEVGGSYARTYRITSLTTANGTSYTAKTDSNSEATIRYNASTKRIEITIEPGFTFNGTK
ncbi:hypothetical protein [Raineya sp.]|jgi:hypothetical protein